ncbi:hypothetical protein [Streptomyces sp. NPDC001275]
MSRFGAGIRLGVMATDQFTQIANGLFRDSRLPYKAKRISGYVSTHRNGWQVTVAELVRRGREGVDAVTSGLKQLDRHGFLYRTRERNPNGTLGQALHFITDLPALHKRPFARDPGRWEREPSRALVTGHVRDSTCSAVCEPVIVYEPTPWGWLAWTLPGEGSPPEIGVLTPTATRMQRLALRWLTRRPAQRIALDTVPGSLRLSAAAVAFISLLTGLFAAGYGIPVDVVLPAMLLALLLAEHLPGRLDARALEHVRTIEGDGLCRYLRPRRPAYLARPGHSRQ